VAKIKHVNVQVKMTQNKVIIDGQTYIEIAGTMVPEELTSDYMYRINPNRDAEIEEERKAHRATIPGWIEPENKK